jgi:hypothetical protein
MKIALVGAHGSSFDVSILADAMLVLGLEGIKPSDLDMIDLRNGRDFLREDLEYDIVILCYIYVATDSQESVLYQMKDLCQLLGIYSIDTVVSPFHSQMNWRKRLQSTKAKSILVFGCYPESEVTGEYVGDLPGYKQEVQTNAAGSVWIYRQCLGSQEALSA